VSLRGSLHDRVRQAALEPDFSTTDWAADCAEDPEHDTDHHKDSADGVKNRKACEVTNQEKDDAEHNHGQSDPVRGFWNWRTRNCQIRQNPNAPSDRPIRRFRHGDVCTAIACKKSDAKPGAYGRRDQVRRLETGLLDGQPIERNVRSCLDLGVRRARDSNCTEQSADSEGSFADPAFMTAARRGV
jgi:hypothetical protein